MPRGTQLTPKRKPVALVSFDPATNIYHRYVGHVVTHSIKMEEPMSAKWLEYFRTSPEAFLAGEDDDDPGPRVA